MTQPQEFLLILQNAQPHLELEWVLDTSSVAAGFEVDSSTIRELRNQHPEEMPEGQAWIRAEGANLILWSKAAVLKMADWIEGDRAAQFKAAIESYQLSAAEETAQPCDVETIELDFEDQAADWIGSMLAAPADEIAWAVLESRLPDAVVQRLTEIIFEPNDFEKQRLKRIFAPYRVDAHGALKNAMQPRLTGGADS